MGFLKGSRDVLKVFQRVPCYPRFQGYYRENQGVLEGFLTISRGFRRPRGVSRGFSQYQSHFRRPQWRFKGHHQVVFEGLQSYQVDFKGVLGVNCEVSDIFRCV